jgi:beta-galactosidase
LEWKVKYAPGTLVARGTYNGKMIEDLRETTGAPAALRLTADRTVLAADDADVAVVNVAVLDAQGRVVPVANDKITFTVQGVGKLIGVGNGDPSSHDPDKGNSRSLFNGLAQAIVQTTGHSGTIRLQAESAGLKSASVTLESR